MKILMLTGQIYPNSSNNTNLISKLLPTLTQNYSVCLACPAQGKKREPLPTVIHGCPVHWITDEKTDFVRRVVFPAIAKVTDPHGYSDAIQALVIDRKLREIFQDFPFDAVISTMEPFPSACAALMLPKRVKKVLYLMDPPNCTCNPAADTPFRRRMLPKVLAGHDLILTTPFIHEALRTCGYGKYSEKIVEVGFPMIETHERHRTKDDITMDKSKINLLFCGWLYSDIRSPKYFLDIAKHLDERFCITFMGKECEKLRERFDFETWAQVVTLPQQPYEVALNAMADADILINIGNSIPVHMPSKTLEYINTGKPIVNFHKLADCPTLHYTKRYPLCLNLHEKEIPDMQTVDRFIRFCTEHKGKSVDTASLPQQLPECTPEYIANVILEKIGANYE